MNARPNLTAAGGVTPHSISSPAPVDSIVEHATIRSAPHHRMVVSKYNVRNKSADTGELKALVRAYGVLHNLIGYLQLVDGIPTGIIEIIGGKRRLAVVGELVAEGELPDDYHLNYLLVTEAEAIEISLAENQGRADMHPADVFDAMLALANAGRAVEDIALMFGIKPLEVQRRLKLANVAPRMLALYRKDEASFEHMMALSVCDDHAAQEQAWDSLGRHYRSPHDLKRLLTAQKINVKSDRVARFVGVAALEKAGGTVTRDLFSDSGAGYTGDGVLLERLALDKLEKLRPKLLSEGMAWVQIMPRTDHAVLSAYCHVRTVAEELSERQREWAAALDERLELLSARIDEIGQDGDEDALSRQQLEHDELAAERRALDANRARLPHPADKALAGAVVTLDEAGAVVVRRNLIRPADKDKMAVLPDSAGTTTPSRRSRPVHSERLMQELTSHRTAALQAELMDRSDVALIYLTYTLMCKVLRTYPATTLAKISLSQPVLADPARKGPAALAFGGRKQQLLDRIRKGSDDESWLTWFAQQPQPVVLELMAFCVACSLDAVQSRDGACPEYAALAGMLQLDMSKWWTATAANYFSHVSHERVMSVVEQALAPEAAVPLEKMKKAAAADAAERAVACAAWLPDVLKA